LGSGLFLAVAVASVGSAQPAPGWATETVDSAGAVGFFNSLAYNPVSGFPAIAYSDEDRQSSVNLASWNGASWDFQVVESGRSVVPQGISLAFDSAGNPAISYGSGQLRFARWTGSVWSIQTVDSNSGTVTSLVFKAGQPAIAYSNSIKKGNKTTNQLKLARLVGSSWTTEVVEEPAGTVLYPSLTYAPDDNPSIAYKVGDALKFAHKAGSSWSTQTVEAGQSGYGTFASLVYDPLTGYPTIAHSIGGSGIRFARWDGSQWVTEVAATGQSVSHESLAYDAAGIAAISYQLSTDGTGHKQLWLARRAGCSATCWQNELIQDFSPAQLAWRTSLAFAPTGAASISFGNYTDRDLKFATQVP
jgi:hypothetical protein